MITIEEFFKVLIGLRAKSFASQEEKSQTSVVNVIKVTTAVAYGRK